MAGEILSQLPEDLRANEAFTGMNTAGDMAKAYLDTKGKLTEFDGKVKEHEGKIVDLEGKLANSYPKLSEKPTDEERTNFFKALGRPDTPEGYEFPVIEGMEKDDRMVKWASNMFYEEGLSKKQALNIGTKWNQFLLGTLDEEEKIAQREAAEAEKTFKEGFKTEDEYKTAKEMSKRYWKKLTNTDFDQYRDEAGHADAIFLKFVYENAKKTGEDTIIPGSQGGTGEVKPGMVYDKTKFPKQQKFI